MLSEVGETIQRWIRVQTDWQKMVSVFTTGDIAKQMPIESKLFRNVDNSWKKIMERASEQKNVIQCCQNDILLNSLGGLQENLDFCQKRLESYLEKKRGVFPRFYFCSNQDLLKILSLGSDPQMVQDDFEKLFDAINRVTFDTTDRRLIKSIHQIFGGAEEDIQLDEPVKCEGNIEDWLCKVEAEMQRSVRTVCQSGS
jgi:dynein heavy chain